MSGISTAQLDFFETGLGGVLRVASAPTHAPQPETATTGDLERFNEPREGGAGMGYHRAGMEVVGVDIEAQPRYPFTFAQADALEFLREFGHEFDFIHASPPCQGYSHLTPEANRGDHAKLIPAVLELLEASGKPWVIENVQGARHELRNPVMLCGSMFGLREEDKPNTQAHGRPTSGEGVP